MDCGNEEIDFDPDSDFDPEERKPRQTILTSFRQETSRKRETMAFRSAHKIRFGDIDRAGIVYYPRFLHYFHIALEEFFGYGLGIDYPTVVNAHRIGLPTVHLETDFFKPLRYGDEIEIEVRVLKIGKTAITFGYRVFRQNETEPRVSGHNVTVCLNMDTFEKRLIPDWLEDRLRKSDSLRIDTTCRRQG